MAAGYSAPPCTQAPRSGPCWTGPVSLNLCSECAGRLLSGVGGSPQAPPCSPADCTSRRGLEEKPPCATSSRLLRQREIWSLSRAL